jgi:hypothetical protein
MADGSARGATHSRPINDVIASEIEAERCGNAKGFLDHSKPADNKSREFGLVTLIHVQG